MLADAALPSPLTEVAAMVPDGVFCLGSALAFHNPTTNEPNTYHIAIRQGAKKRLHGNMPVTLHHFSAQQYETGLSEYKIDAYSVRVYNPEKTLCDIIRFRNTLVPGIVKEALENYMKMKTRDLPELREYSKIMKIEKILDRYMEVMV